jgi:hypothetical protein
MGLFSRQAPSSAPSAPSQQLDLATALEIVLVKSVESQATLAQKISDMVVGQLETMTTVFARRLGSRGGRANALKNGGKRNHKGQFTQRRGACRLCDNPAIADPTADEIRAHATHQYQPAELPALPYRTEGNKLIADVNFEQVQTDAQGNQIIECEDCQSGKAHTHAGNPIH